MKLKQAAFSLIRGINKYGILSGITRPMAIAKSAMCPEVLHGADCSHEKLQIMYANLRV